MCREEWYRRALGSISVCQGVMLSHQQWSRQDWWGCGWGGGHFALIVWRVWPTHWVWNVVWPQLSLFYTPSVALWASVRHQMIQRLVGRFSVQTTVSKQTQLSQELCQSRSPLASSITFLSGWPVWCSSQSLTLWMGLCVCLDVCMDYYAGMNGYFSLL